MNRVTLIAFAVCAAPLSFGQETTPPAEKKAPPPASALLTNLNPRNVGPTTMGGRINALAVYEKDPRIFYIGTAAGGVWKTENYGITTTPIFQKEASCSIGALAVSQKDPKVLWVATGEGVARNSSSWGNGVYKSTDGGATFQHMGLDKCRHFHKIIIDPRNDDVVYAAGLGDLWGYNEDRGLYKTTDGGKTWNKIWYLDEKTGVSELIMNPKNPNELLMSSYEKKRFAYDWISGGPGSAIYKSKDAGKTWKKITKGLPEGTLGRIGMDYFHKDPKHVVALLEHRNFTTNVRETGCYISKDGGESWTKQSATNPRPFYFSIPRWDPQDINRIYVPGVQTFVSDDMGKTFRNFPQSVHVDHHAYWINPANNNTLIIGEDGGVAVSFDRGGAWRHVNTMPIGQFYAVAYDMRKPYWVYGGLQDNGTWATPTQTDQGGVTFFHAFTYAGGDGFHVAVDPNDWSTAYGESQQGGMVRQDLKAGGGRSIRPGVNNTIGLVQGERVRWNWSTPFVLSPFNSQTIYAGGNRLFKSVNRGDNWRVISPDLTTNDPTKITGVGSKSVSPEATGAENHCTIITVNESERKQGLLWVGTDDGKVWVTEDDGNKWTDVTGNFKDVPANTWVSRVIPSRFDTNRAYVTFDGHRNNDYNAYVYMTEDLGKTWTKINGNLPAESTYVIREGMRNQDLLLLGTEFSMWISLDRGKSWDRFTSGTFPTVRVDDIVLHPRDGDIIVGTHGRSIWLIPYLGLEDMTAENRDKDMFLTKPAPVYNFGRVHGRQWDGDGIYQSPNTQPGTTIFYYLKETATSDVTITITDAAGATVRTFTGSKTAGLNSVYWNGRRGGGGGGAVLRAADYGITLKVGDKELKSSVTVENVIETGTWTPPKGGVDRR